MLSHQRLRELRKRAGFTLKDLEPLLDRSYTQLSRIERGRSDPPLQLVIKWCQVCGADLAILDDRSARVSRTVAALDSSEQAMIMALAVVLPDVPQAQRYLVAAMIEALERFQLEK